MRQYEPTRRFKAATGETPINYLQQLRINAARHLLENDLKTVQEISRKVGYEDLSFFTSFLSVIQACHRLLIGKDSRSILPIVLLMATGHTIIEE